MSWLADYVPWYVWLGLSLAGIGGGTAALIIFVPAALPFVLGIWNRLPLWLRVLLVAVFVSPFVYLAGRQQGRRNEQDRRDQANARAVQTRKEVDDEVRKDSDSDVDRKLDRWMRND